jgi:archaellum component FlaC
LESESHALDHYINDLRKQLRKARDEIERLENLVRSLEDKNRALAEKG